MERGGDLCATCFVVWSFDTPRLLLRVGERALKQTDRQTERGANNGRGRKASREEKARESEASERGKEEQRRRDRRKAEGREGFDDDDDEEEEIGEEHGGGGVRGGAVGHADGDVPEEMREVFEGVRRETGDGEKVLDDRTQIAAEEEKKKKKKKKKKKNAKNAKENEEEFSSSSSSDEDDEDDSGDEKANDGLTRKQRKEMKKATNSRLETSVRKARGGGNMGHDGERSGVFSAH